MDTFIGSTDRGKEGSRGRGRKKRREERRGLVMGPGLCRPVALLMRPSQIAAYQITHNHQGQGLMNAVMAHQSRLLPAVKTLVNNSAG